MLRHMKRRKRKLSSVPAKAKPKGFDYGGLPWIVAHSSIEFPRYLSTASIVAVLYSGEWSEATNQTVPMISLVAQHGDELAKAFEEFNNWSDVTDPDSVEITFVFRKSGGYLFAISPELSRLERRCLGFDCTYQVLAAHLIWIKEINTVHPLLQRFREHCSAPIAPFLFGGVAYGGLQASLSTCTPSDIENIQGLQSLLKFEVTLVDEDDVKPNSTGWMALRVADAGWQQQAPSSPTGPPKPSPNKVAKQRIKTLRHHFPVTLERIRRSSSVPVLVPPLVADAVRPWQIEQALCNLVLSTEMGRGVHFSGLSGRKTANSIVEALTARYEVADGGDIPVFTIDDVRTQILADGNALLRFLGKKERIDLAETQAALQSASALEAVTAIDPPGDRSSSS